MMHKTLPTLARAAALLTAAMLSIGSALAQAPDLFTILSQLQRDPAFAGQVLTTQQFYPDPNSGYFLYEVRILRPDDRIVIVYIDPMSGQIVSVSGG